MKHNLIIAEFMGVGHLFEYQSSNQFNHYHESWDSLIPVVKEIQKIEQVYLHDDIEIIEDLDNALGELNLTKVYHYVGSFIEYHNENTY